MSISVRRYSNSFSVWISELFVGGGGVSVSVSWEEVIGAKFVLR